MQNTTLIQLGDQYIETAASLDELILKYTKLLKAEYKRHNYLKVYEIKRKLAIFYDQKRDVMTTAYKLKNYYEKETEDKKDESYTVIC